MNGELGCRILFRGGYRVAKVALSWMIVRYDFWIVYIYIYLYISMYPKKM